MLSQSIHLSETQTFFNEQQLTPVVRVSDVAKTYRIYDHPEDRLKQMIFGRFNKAYGREFSALHAISFDVYKGETVGIIGRNGSGKSTLLQIIAGTLAPSFGSTQITGRIAALLELGSGFNPEFTGRENVYLNGAILGISRKEMEERFDSIADFAEIGGFIDQPVKIYSSGMLIRLAFAVQAGIDPDVLIVDEALAVGDVFFRQKCYRRLEELRSRGVSIMFVTHAMADVEQYCQRAILLDKGKAIFIGDAKEAVKKYYLLEQVGRTAEVSLTSEFKTVDEFRDHESIFRWPTINAFVDITTLPQISNGWACCTAVAITDAEDLPRRIFQYGETASFFCEFELFHDIEIPIGGISLTNDHGIEVHGKNTLQYVASSPIFVSQGRLARFRFDIVLMIAEGEYTFEVGIATIGVHDFQHRTTLTPADLYARTLRLCHIANAGAFVVTHQVVGTPTRQMHHGIADLPGCSDVYIL